MEMVRQTGSCCGIEENEGFEQPVREQKPEHAADGGERMASPSSWRPSRRRFAPSAWRPANSRRRAVAARHEQRGKIDAHDQLHEDDGDAKQHQGLALITDQVFVQRPEDREMPLRIVVGVRLGQ